MKAHAGLASALVALAAVHLAALAAPFLSAYDPTEQNRTLPYAPPTRVHMIDGGGRFRWRPFVYRMARRGDGEGYEEDRRRSYPVLLLVRAVDPAGAGRVHLFGVEEPARIFLLGTDGFGRDLFSRLLHGARISLFAGVMATVLSLALGWLLGVAAGYYGRWVDSALMRSAELFLALPWLYLLFAVRAVLPLRVSSGEAFLLLVLLIGLVDWARPARLIRGVVLSARERSYVLAARGFGASDLYLIRRHIAPQTLGLLLTQAAVVAPQYVLAEVTLSFLGLGVSEPTPSWGNMLASLQQYHVLVSYWWMWAPGFALLAVSLAYYALSEVLHRAGSAE